MGKKILDVPTTDEFGSTAILTNKRVEVYDDLNVESTDEGKVSYSQVAASLNRANVTARLGQRSHAPQGGQVPAQQPGQQPVFQPQTPAHQSLTSTQSTSQPADQGTSQNTGPDLSRQSSGQVTTQQTTTEDHPLDVITGGDRAFRDALIAAGLDSVKKVSLHDFTANKITGIGEGRAKTIKAYFDGLKGT